MAEGDGQEVAWLGEVVESIQLIHDLILTRSGGVQGVHAASLYGACARPFQTFDGNELYPRPFLKVAALFHAIISDHAFVDGNKRTASVAATLFLGSQGLLTQGPPSRLQVRMLGELAVATADSASGRMGVEDVANWLRRIFDAGLEADA